MRTLLFLLYVSSAFASVSDACWKWTSTRGAGVPFDACPSGMEESGALCYPQCKSGYSGKGPVCWENCASGWEDQGALCALPLVIISSDNSKCHWYDMCGLTFDKGCSKCPAGYDNDGCTCRKPGQTVAKKSYGRGAGVSMVCSSKYDQSGALCYPACPSSTDGVGPVCWGQCSSSFPVECAGTICGAQGFNCTKQIQTFINDCLHTIEACHSYSTIQQCVKQIIQDAKDFKLDGICSKP